MSILFVLIIGILGFTFSPAIVTLLGLEKDIADLAITYLRTIFLGMPLMCTSIIFEFLLRAYGDTVTPMKVEGVTVLLNLVLDPILIFGLLGVSRMGVLKVFLFGVPFFGIFSAVNACFLGSGRNVPSMVIELSRFWGLRIPLNLIFGFVVGWNATGVWFGMGLSNVPGAVVALTLFETEYGRKRLSKMGDKVSQVIIIVA